MKKYFVISLILIAFFSLFILYFVKNSTIDIIAGGIGLSAIFSTLFTEIITSKISQSIQHEYTKKMQSHDLKIYHYKEVSKQLAALVTNTPNQTELVNLLNQSLILSSDNVVKEILKFNKLFSEKRKQAKEKNETKIPISADDIKPLFITIREELDLKSDSIKELRLNFFQIVNPENKP